MYVLEMKMNKLTIMNFSDSLQSEKAGFVVQPFQGNDKSNLGNHILSFPEFSLQLQ